MRPTDWEGGEGGCIDCFILFYFSVLDSSRLLEQHQDFGNCAVAALASLCVYVQVLVVCLSGLLSPLNGELKLCCRHSTNTLYMSHLSRK